MLPFPPLTNCPKLAELWVNQQGLDELAWLVYLDNVKTLVLEEVDPTRRSMLNMVLKVSKVEQA